MPTTEKKPTVTLEALLHVKRNERPDSDFWNSFDSNFERRRLHAMVEQKSILEILWTPTFKTLAFSLPALLLIGLTAFWVRYQKPMESAELAIHPSPLHVPGALLEATSSPRKTEEVALSAEIEAGASSQFVVDAIEDKGRHPLNFRKVLYTPAIRLSIPTGASYVRDNMSSRNYGVTTADMKLGRNF